MKEIEGIDLNSLLEAEERELFAEKRKKVQGQINGILLDVSRWENEERKLIASLKKCQEKLGKARGKLEEIRKGGENAWKVLGDPNEGQGKEDGER